jgi:hypothetical protein
VSRERLDEIERESRKYPEGYEAELLTIARAALSAQEALRSENAGLREALEPFAENGIDLSDRICHRGLIDQTRCSLCSLILGARHALASPAPAVSEAEREVDRG